MNRTTIALCLPLLASSGCGNGHGPSHASEEHVHAPVHEGALVVELGEHFAQLEVAVDAAAGSLSLWFWDDDLENTNRLTHEAIPVEVTVGDETFTVTCAAQASGLTGETVGDSSEFRGSDARLEGAALVAGRLTSVTVRGTAFEGVTFRWPAEDH